MEQQIYGRMTGKRRRTHENDADYTICAEELRIVDMPERLRPREEAERIGLENVSDDVLLALILRTGVQGRNVVTVARRLIHQFGSLTALATCSSEDLESVEGIGRVKAQIIKASLELSVRLTEEREPPRRMIKTPKDVADVLREMVRCLEREVFWVLLVDAKNRLKGRPVDITSGLLDASLVHPREVFRSAIKSAAAGVVLVHNHPSGDPSPSAQDISVTKQLVEAGGIVDIKVLDHVILGKPSHEPGKEFLSVRESGLVAFH